jgi:ribosome maturation factor RimP
MVLTVESRRFSEGFGVNLAKIVNLLPYLPFRIIHGLLEARRFRPVGSRPLFILGDRFFWRLTMGASSVEERVRAIAEQVAIDHGVELVHVEVAGPDNKPIVRIFIDKPNGVTHEDCSEVSFHVGTVLDVEDFIHASYTLEVSSPGLERGLYKRDDYDRFAGNLVKIKTRSPISGQRNFRGRLIGISGDTVAVEDRTSGRVLIPFDSISKANLEMDFEQELRRARAN